MQKSIYKYTIFQQGSTFVNITHKQRLKKGNNLIRLPIHSKLVNNSLYVVPKGDSFITNIHIIIAKNKEDHYNRFKKYEGKIISFIHKGKKHTGELVELSGSRIILKIKGDYHFFNVGDIKVTLPRIINKSSNILINVYSDKAVSEEFSISYIANSLLSWEPVYHMHLEGDRAKLVHYALIKNESDSMIKKGQFICVAGDIEHAGSNYLGRGLYSFDYASAARSRPKPQFKQVTELQRYSTPDDYDLKPGEQVKIPIGSFNISFKSKYFIEGERVMMKNEFINDSNTLINASSVILYSLNEFNELVFIGEKRINAVPYGKTFFMNAGIPANITVVKSIKKLINNKKAYITTVKNLSDKEIIVNVKEYADVYLRDVKPKEYEYANKYITWSDYKIKSNSEKEFYYIS